MPGPVLEEVPCTACGATTPLMVATTASVGLAPWMRDAALRGDLHLLRCRRCGRSAHVERALLYVDMERGHWIGVFPSGERAQHEERAAMTRTSFGWATGEQAPAVVRGHAARFRLRVVFGMLALREKLLCWEHGLDDGALELLKLDVLGDRPELLEAGVMTLRLDSVRPDGMLGLVPTFVAAPDPSVRGVWVPRVTYDEELAALPQMRPAHDALLDGAFVDILRYAAA